MAGIVVLGTQWGDEGKGRLVDYLAKKAKIVVRFSGGNNAGHTVVYGNKTFLFTILPSGALYGKKLMIAAGACFDPEILLSEIKIMEKEGIKVNLMIDPRVHIVMPYHRQRDVANEARRGKTKIGSVGFGIGYCFVDRARRGNLRFEDLIEPERLKKTLAYYYPRNKETLAKLYGVKIQPEAKMMQALKAYGQKLRPYLGDVSLAVNKALAKKEMIVFEGSQGVLLDLNFGTYPFTTGCHVIAGYVFSSVGLAPQKLTVIGVVKSFSSRADTGAGPMPTEMPTDKGPGKHILIKGHEFEEFVGVPVRARRVGWLDLPLLRYGHQLNQFSALALTHLDTLGGLKKVFVCTQYSYGGKGFLLPRFPGMTDKLKPVYKKMKGWPAFDSTKIRTFADLPKEARDYVKLIEKEVGVPVKYLSLGPERNSMLIR